MDVTGFPRPQLDLRKETFLAIINAEIEEKLYIRSSLVFLVRCYMLSHVGQTGYVELIAELTQPTLKALGAGLLAVDSGQEAVIRDLLWEVRDKEVGTTSCTVEEFTSKISELRDQLGNNGDRSRDGGLPVPIELGGEGKVTGSIACGDTLSRGSRRTAEGMRRILYGTGNASKTGCFYPDGAAGPVAQLYLNRGKAKAHHYP